MHRLEKIVSDFECDMKVNKTLMKCLPNKSIFIELKQIKLYSLVEHIPHYHWFESSGVDFIPCKHHLKNCVWSITWHYSSGDTVQTHTAETLVLDENTRVWELLNLWCSFLLVLFKIILNSFYCKCIKKVTMKFTNPLLK